MSLCVSKFHPNSGPNAVQNRPWRVHAVLGHTTPGIHDLGACTTCKKDKTARTVIYKKT